MKFRLTYQGPLVSTQRERYADQRQSNGILDNKHDIRKVFHRQLQRLWEITPFLKNGERSGPSVLLLSQGPNAPRYDKAYLAQKHNKYGFSFVPLVTFELDLICELDILFLRPDRPGNLWKGDIDNRLKTLFDAMAIPTENERYGERRTPTDDEEPFHCLLEDDRLITKISVETDQLLEFVSPPPDHMSDVRLIVTVTLRPQEMTLGNMQFG